jgi:delta 1-pyrroline-5-carboxylate dehydrogenase
MGGRPEYREALSRSSGWSDSIVAIESSGAGNRADLAEVFRGGRSRQIAIRICPTNRNDRCSSRSYAVDWNGQTAFVSGDAVTAGTFRVVEGDDESDAWVRFVVAGDADRVRAAYTANLAALDTWSLPPDAESAPSLQRMRRVILATVTD